MSAGSYQSINYGISGSGFTLTLRPTNSTSGQNVYVCIFRAGGVQSSTYTIAGEAGSAGKIFSSGSVSIGAGKLGAVQMQMFGTNLIFSAGGL